MSEDIKPARLREALDCYFSYWNDFTHPGFFSLAVEASGGQPADLVKPQAALAMMSAAFDIHDDIIDGSRRKHDHMTVFGKFGQDISILLGNAFLIKGFTLLSDSALDLSGEKEREVFAVVKESLFEVGNAHALELEMKHRLNVSPKKYLQVLEMKAASVEADMHIATLMAGGSERQIKTIKEYGRIVGILATLREEFVDTFELEELKRRIRRETLPIPIMYGLKSPKSKEKILKMMRKRKITEKDVDELAHIVLDMKPVLTLRKRMKELCQRGVALAQQMPQNEPATLSARLVQSMLEDL